MSYFKRTPRASSLCCRIGNSESKQCRLAIVFLTICLISHGIRVVESSFFFPTQPPLSSHWYGPIGDPYKATSESRRSRRRRPTQEFVVHPLGLQFEPSPLDRESQKDHGHIPTDVNHDSHNNHTLMEVDVLYERSSELVYDPLEDRYQVRSIQTTKPWAEGSNSLTQFFHRVIAPLLSVAFLPSGVTPNYYQFLRWRVFQRFVNANLHVFGTQSLLLGLGLKSSASQLGALSAALKWVLKDALGKLVRMAWASRMGRQFDSDAKRWRYRSAFVFGLGNALEIMACIIPSMFLVWATLANCCKQVSMLTSSSTRTAIYNSFRDGSRENIGDITAKGEAQIAIVELLGIASGVLLSRLVATSIQNVLLVYAILQIVEIVCVYRTLRTVVYRVLNFERMAEIVNEFLDSPSPPPPSPPSPLLNGSSASSRSSSIEAVIKSPIEMAQTERLFLPPQRLSRRAAAFGSLGRTKLSPQELERLLTIFAKERFLLVVGANSKRKKFAFFVGRRRKTQDKLLQEHCHIVLHKDATNSDIVKSTLALFLLRRKLMARDDLDPWTVRSLDCFPILQETLQETEENYGLLKKQLSKQGWESPSRFMFGRVHMRADWPLTKK